MRCLARRLRGFLCEKIMHGKNYLIISAQLNWMRQTQLYIQATVKGYYEKNKNEVTKIFPNSEGQFINWDKINEGQKYRIIENILKTRIPYDNITFKFQFGYTKDSIRSGENQDSEVIAKCIRIV